MRIYSFLFLAALSHVLAAQEKPIVYALKEVVSFGDQGFVLIQTDHQQAPGHVKFQFFNYQQELVQERELSLERSSLFPQFEAAFAWDGKLNLLTSLYYPGPKRNHLMLYQFTVPDLEEVNAEVIDEAYTPELYRVPFGYAISPDKSKIAFYGWTYTLPEDPAKLNITVFDQGLVERWEQRYVLPFRNETLFLYDCEVTDAGEVYMLGENYLGKVGPIINERKIQYFALGAQAGEQDLTVYYFNEPNELLSGIKMYLGPDNALYAAGFYHENNRGSHAGLSLFRVDHLGGGLEKQRLAIPEETYERAYLYGDREPSFNAQRHRFDGYTVDHIQPTAAGGLLIVAEQRIADSNSGSLEMNDILAIQIENGGRIAWLKRISKRQFASYFQEEYPLSYRYIYREGSSFFLFNDAIANYRNAGANRGILSRYEGDGEAVVLMELSAAGNIVRRDLTGWLRASQMDAIRPKAVWEARPDYLLLRVDAFRGGNATTNLVGLSWEEIMAMPRYEIRK